MSVLDSIIEGVREDLARRRKPLSQLQEELAHAPAIIDAHSALRKDELTIIAEVKRSSPSKGALATIANPASLAATYQESGAAVVSVLTEERRFGGSLQDLRDVRSAITIPILRKDFMVDEYQFLEARAAGADLVLLIVAALSKNQLKDYYDLARELGMAVLVETHTEAEIEDAMAIDPQIVGVNARNLKTLEIDTSAFTRLIPLIPSTVIRVAESGISQRGEVEVAGRAGAQAILVGETLVRAGDPRIAIDQLLGRTK